MFCDLVCYVDSDLVCFGGLQAYVVVEFLMGLCFTDCLTLRVV